MTKLNKKILIVEDDRALLLGLQEKFEREGFSVVTAQDGEEGLKAVKEKKPNLILLDILLPKIDGITVAQKLKEAGNQVPIIFLTNLSDLEYVSKALELGKFDYLVKSDWSIDNVVGRAKEKLGLK